MQPITMKPSELRALVQEEKKDDTSVNLSDKDQEGTEEHFADKFFTSVIGALNIQTAYLGYKLGWYTALKDAGQKGLTAAELTQQTQTSPRYAREWLEMQAVAGWIKCHDANEAADTRRYWLPTEHGAVLAEPDSLSYYIPLAGMMAGTAKALDDLVQAYRDDTGISWHDLGDHAREGQANMNRPFFLQKLPALLEGVLDKTTVTKLRNGEGRIADIGAGYGWSSIGLAKHFATSHLEIYDVDAPSVERAKVHIAKEGLQNRIQAFCEDAANASGTFDLVLALECIHDMPDPIGVLKTMRELAGAAGTVIVMDELTNETFSTEPNPLEHFLYGISCVCCLPDGKSAGASSAATGTIMRPSVFRMYAQQAGFKEVEILPIENDLFRFYKLVV